MTRAVVREVDGRLVLDDPDALAMVQVVNRHNCLAVLKVEEHAERVRHFAQRIAERGKTGRDLMIVVLNVDDLRGGALADELMPGHDWDAIRARGQTPYARGLVVRGGIEDMLAATAPRAAKQLAAIDGVAILAMDFDAVEVFELSEVV